MTKKKVLTLICIVLIASLGWRFFGQKQIEIKPLPPREIYEEELTKFLHTWSDYLENNTEDESLSMGSGEIPHNTKQWLIKRDWEPMRFFYVEDRVKAIIKSAHLREHANATIAILRSQLKTEEDEVAVNTIKELIDQQSQSYNVEKITKREMDMVTKNLAYIESIIEGKSKF